MTDKTPPAKPGTRTSANQKAWAWPRRKKRVLKTGREPLPEGHKAAIRDALNAGKITQCEPALAMGAEIQTDTSRLGARRAGKRTA